MDLDIYQLGLHSYDPDLVVFSFTPVLSQMPQTRRVKLVKQIADQLALLPPKQRVDQLNSYYGSDRQLYKMITIDLEKIFGLPNVDEFYVPTVYARYLPRVIKGILALCQKVAITILTTPGTDKFNTKYGGGVETLIGFDIQPSDDTELKARTMSIVSKTQQDITLQQSGQGLPQSELLSRLILRNVYTGGELGDKIFIDIDVKNQAQETYPLLLPLGF